MAVGLAVRTGSPRRRLSPPAFGVARESGSALSSGSPLRVGGPFGLRVVGTTARALPSWAAAASSESWEGGRRDGGREGESEGH